MANIITFVSDYRCVWKHISGLKFEENKKIIVRLSLKSETKSHCEIYCNTQRFKIAIARY